MEFLISKQNSGILLVQFEPIKEATTYFHISLHMTIHMYDLTPAYKPATLLLFCKLWPNRPAAL
jgi:hypothetical protein